MPIFSPDTILVKRTSVAGRVPLLSSLSLGEFAVNTTDGLIFLKQQINNQEVLINFPNSKIIPYTLNQSLSSVNFQYGNNSISQVLASILGGINNSISGAGSTIVTGESNLISADFATILNGYNNRIIPTGNYSSILGGQNNLISHQNSFTLGTNLSSHADNFTYVNNISGKFWGEGSEIYSSTLALGTSSTKLATTAFVQDAMNSGTAVAAVVVAQVSNADSVQLTRGMVVYAFGSQGDKVSVKRASSVDDTTSSKTFGIVNETIAINGTGYITLAGTMNKLSLGSPYVAGDALWLDSTPGQFTRVKPVAPLHSVFIGVVERANNGNGTAYIKIQNGYELNEIHDVLITSPSASQILQRNQANTLWINADPYLGTDLKALSANWQNTYTTVSNNSASYVTLSATQTLTNKTVVDWMTLVRGYKTTPTLNTTIATGEVWNYVYTSSPSDKTYYRFIATDGSEDSFYGTFSGGILSNLITTKKIIL